MIKKIAVALRHDEHFNNTGIGIGIVVGIIYIIL
uniref:Uncharacterized protein n=1 Tax=viral metagenome TaxID=1070528 RepID=A0A6C0LUP4_9ZZZZ